MFNNKPTQSMTLLYILFGLAGSFVLIIFATLVETTRLDLAITLSNFFRVQSDTVLLWIIDTTPIVIGTLAGILGQRQTNMAKLSNQLAYRLEEEQDLIQQLDKLNQDLESKVEERTQVIELRAKYLEAAAEVGRAATSIYQLEELLPKVVDLISEKFGFYQTGIFIVDHQTEDAILRAASSTGGKRMLARGHRLKVGAEGIVGFVTNTGEVRIALNVGDDAYHFNTPELPNTKSEMALPLFYGGRVFGALDVQSTEENAFSEEDISVLKVLADQVSMAINNAILFEEIQSNIEAERKSFIEANRANWQEFVSSSDQFGFKYTQNRVLNADQAWPEDMVTAMSSQEIVTQSSDYPVLSLPILVSGQPIGAIRLSKAPKQPQWSEDEIDLIKTLTERISQAVESARLFQETQKQAAQEQLTTEISTNLRKTLDINTVLQTAAREFGQTFNANEVIIRMNPDEAK